MNEVTSEHFDKLTTESRIKTKRQMNYALVVDVSNEAALRISFNMSSDLPEAIARHFIWGMR